MPLAAEAYVHGATVSGGINGGANGRGEINTGVHFFLPLNEVEPDPVPEESRINSLLEMGWMARMAANNCSFTASYHPRPATWILCALACPVLAQLHDYVFRAGCLVLYILITPQRLHFGWKLRRLAYKTAL